MTKFAKLAAAALAAALFTMPAYASDQTELVDHATATAHHLKTDPAFAPAHDQLSHAKAILIVPNLVKGGFIFGAEGGNGVLLERTGTHGWSAPAFYTIGSGSFGLQAGLEKAEIVLLIMSDRALKGIEQGDVKLGAGAGITVVTLSGGAEAATPANLAGDIVVWTSATGLYGGLTLNGSVVKDHKEWNDAFYGKPVTESDILRGKVRSPAAHALQRELQSIW
jgi:lipid-binding SYLF domain-containing protein